MFFGQFIDELADRIKLDKNNPDLRSILGVKINNAYKEVALAHNWEHLKVFSEMQTVANYTDGTVSIATGSYTIIGSGTTWTSAMEGRYFKSGNNDNPYRIVRVVSGNELVLQTPILESDGSGLSYTIWKRFYYLDSDVRRILDFGSWVNDGKIRNKSNSFISDISTNISNTGRPDFFTVIGSDRFDRKYSTGSIAVTKNTDLLIGTSTFWLANAGPGDLVTIGTQRLRVKRVESDTRIRLLNNSVGGASAGSAYTIEKDNPIGVQFYLSPDKTYQIQYSYIKRVYSMVNENYDKPELPEDFDLAILDGAEASRMKDMDDDNWTLKIQEYTGRVSDLRSTQRISTPRFRQMSPYIPTRKGY